MPDRAAAWALVCAHTAGESLRRHMLAVEAAMRAYAERLGEDLELWGNTGLLHDFDYEAHPDTHPMAGAPILEAAGWPEPLRRAILAHADYSGVPRDTPLARHLHACDDVTGLITATALVRPDRNLRGVDLASLRKKWKNRAFAAGVDRDAVAEAAEAIGASLDAHLETVLSAMQGIAGELGLAGVEGEAPR